MINNQKSKDYGWQKIILGIRKKLDLSQTQLVKKISLGRQSISRFEAKQRAPNKDSIQIIIRFIKENNLNIEELIKLGNDYSNEYTKREKVAKLDLENSEELAELIGIILGDGEIKKDGSIRIAFDPKKDKNFLNRRVFLLVKTLLNNKIGFESYKRIHFGNMAFVRYLKSIDLNPGSKFESDWKIPDWCFDKQYYTSAVLRGLFDTDGYFGYLNGSLEIMLGRFSDRSYNLVKSISLALNNLAIKHRIKQSKDKRYKVLITNKVDVIKFLNLIGTSNLKHIVRFLLWRLNKYEAKIELEGLGNLLKIIHRYIDINIEDVNLPFFWNFDNEYFLEYIKIDLDEVHGAEIRNLYKWPEVTKNLIKLIGNKALADYFNITERSVRKWREGIRNPSERFILNLIELSKANNINLEAYKVKNANTKCEGPR